MDRVQYWHFLGKVLPRLLMSKVVERPPTTPGGSTRPPLMKTIRRGYSGLSRAPMHRVTQHDAAYLFCIILCYCLDWLDVPLKDTPKRALREVLMVELKSLKHDNDQFADSMFTPRPL